MPDHGASQLTGKLRQLSNTRTSGPPERSLVPVETTRREVEPAPLLKFLPGKDRTVSLRTAPSLESTAHVGASCAWQHDCSVPAPRRNTMVDRSELDGSRLGEVGRRMKERSEPHRATAALPAA